MCNSEKKAKQYEDRVCLKCEGDMEPVDIISTGGTHLPIMKYVVYECTNCHSILYTPKTLAKKKKK